MIDRDGNQLLVTCDGCRTTEEFDWRETPFAAMIDELKTIKGWLIFRERTPDAGWEHWCPDCRGDRIPFEARQPSGAQRHKAAPAAAGARAPMPARPSTGAGPGPNGPAPVLPFPRHSRRRP